MRKSFCLGIFSSAIRYTCVRGALAICLFLLLFTSCENFLNGEKIKQEIEDEIAYANAQAYTIRVEAPGSSGVVKSPAGGSVSKKVTDKFTVSFDPSTDWAFIRWKIMDAASETELPNGDYLNISSLTDAETQCTFENPPEDGMELVLVPVLAERPQIISYSPSTYGMLKDSVIQVLFDSDMDPFSIYYTEDELKQMKNSGVTDGDFLPEIDETNPIDSNNHYGYINSSGETVFKNITMANKKTKQNLNGCFGAPVFENASTLSIPVKEKDSLPDYTQVLVTMGQGFFYSRDEKTVEMAGSKKWLYQVNNKTDTKPLIVSKTGTADNFVAKISASDELALPQGTSYTVNTSGSGSGISTLKYIKEDNLLYLDLQVQEPEMGSGPKSYFTIMLKRIYGKNYVSVPSSEKEKTVLVDFQNVTADDAVIDGYIDLNDLYDADSGEKLTLEDGVYAMSFVFEDNSGNKLTYPADEKKYYFAKDTTPPDIDMPTIKSSNSTTYTLEWKDSFDLNTTEIIYGIDGSTMTTSSFAKGTTFVNIEDIAPGNKYVVEVKFTDYAGNVTEKTIPKFLTGYYIEGTLDFTRTNASHASNVFFAGDKMSDYGVNSIKIAWSDGSVEDAISSGYKIPSGPNNNGSYNTDWKIFYKKVENVSKYAASGAYYIAKKDSLTQTPSSWQAQETDGNRYWFYKFGDYPQSVSTISSYTSGTVYNGWYLGSDGYFYAKCLTNVFANDKTTAGGKLTNNTYYYFKVMPVEWRCASNNFNDTGKKLLIARKNLDGVQYYTSTSNRTVNGSTIKPNNYQYSTLRAFLNGKYESGDTQSKSYQNQGFLQKAFTPSARSLIYEGSVENDAKTTNPNRNSSEWGNGVNVNTCDTTCDKVFVLSVQEATNTALGFDAGPDWELHGLRLIHTTDYAKARHVCESNDSDNSGTYKTFASEYWLRSPSRTEEERGKARCIETAGKVQDREVTNSETGVVPCIVLN